MKSMVLILVLLSLPFVHARAEERFSCGNLLAESKQAKEKYENELKNVQNIVDAQGGVRRGKLYEERMLRAKKLGRRHEELHMLFLCKGCLATKPSEEQCKPVLAEHKRKLKCREIFSAFNYYDRLVTVYEDLEAAKQRNKKFDELSQHGCWE